ncbi:hypothetical protein [Mesorhizobium sp.]|uniref:hypothetical protein n=1 Tax=Mesorhizobium sp. TaxID=1871066 RepID=UPI0025F7ABF1|nr:hypothetical protein [Mesorhizobium sp.]
MPLSTTAWTIFFALGIALAWAGYDFRRLRFVPDPAHWSNDIAYSVMVIGRLLTLLAVLLFVAGERFVQGGLHF